MSITLNFKDKEYDLRPSEPGFLSKKKKVVGFTTRLRDLDKVTAGDGELAFLFDGFGCKVFEYSHLASGWVRSDEVRFDSGWKTNFQYPDKLEILIDEEISYFIPYGRWFQTLECSANELFLALGEHELRGKFNFVTEGGGDVIKRINYVFEAAAVAYVRDAILELKTKSMVPESLTSTCRALASNANLCNEKYPAGTKSSEKVSMTREEFSICLNCLKDILLNISVIRNGWKKMGLIKLIGRLFNSSFGLSISEEDFLKVIYHHTGAGATLASYVDIKDKTGVTASKDFLDTGALTKIIETAIPYSYHLHQNPNVVLTTRQMEIYDGLEMGDQERYLSVLAEMQKTPL